MTTLLSLVLEAHQPIRLNKAFANQRVARIANGKSVTDQYFDKRGNEEIFKKIVDKCYLRTFRTLAKLMEKKNDSTKNYRFKVSLGLSGTFLEQAMLYSPVLIDELRTLLRSGRVEILGGTYHHSLSSLFTEKSEFIEQVNQHRALVRSLLRAEVRVFDNTEFLYNDSIGRIAGSLGFAGVLTEGAESVLGSRSPNHVYLSAGARGPKLLMRHYRLSDDIGFRFSQKNWQEYPLTAEKFAHWLSLTPGDNILLGLDIETFGEHHWADTGIFEFLESLPDKVCEKDNLSWALPSEVIEQVQPADAISVPDQSTTSWADCEKDTSAWLQNPMQKMAFERVAALESFVKEIDRKEVTDIWRLLQQSDLFYYMSTKDGPSGRVHSYFNPNYSAAEAFAVFDSVLTDYEGRIGVLALDLKRKRDAINRQQSEAASYSSKFVVKESGR